MSNLDKIISKIEEFAPPSLARQWDNPGWQVYLGNKNINKIMLALSPTPDVIESAVKKDCELLITHHPMIFEKVKTLSVEDYANLALIKAVRGNLQVYCAHTNLDVAEGGIADILAEKLELKNISPAEPGDTPGFGRKGELSRTEDLSGLISKVKQLLNTNKIKLINPANVEKIRKIAVLPGSGGGFIPLLKDIDLYITGDVKYHDALLVRNFAVIDAGHFETEKVILPVLKELLKEFETEIFLAEEKVPWKFVL